MWVSNREETAYCTLLRIMSSVGLTTKTSPVSEGEVHQRLCSESVLLIRREDVLQRLTADCCLTSLSESSSDPRWKALDVEGRSLSNTLLVT